VTRKYFSLLLTFLYFIIAGFLYSCTENKTVYWNDTLSNKNILVILPDNNDTIDNFLNQAFIPFFDDITPSAFQIGGLLDERITENGKLRAVALFPETADFMQPLWIVETGENKTLLNQLKANYQRNFIQNNYDFQGITIEKLFISSVTVYITGIDDFLLISESSLAIENSIRALNNPDQRLAYQAANPESLSILLNTPQVSEWIQQLAGVEYRPFLKNAFEGTNPILLFQSEEDFPDLDWRLKGDMKIENPASPFIQSISGTASKPVLDRFIPSNAAAFGIFRSEPKMIHYPQDSLSKTGKLDQYLIENESFWRNIAGALGNEVAFAAFAESGAMSTSEFLFLREVKNAGNLRNALNRLAEEELVTKTDNSYFFQSKQAGQLFSGDMNPFLNFYLSFAGDRAVVLSRRKGLSESVQNDAERRRVIFYEDRYMNIRSGQPDAFSSLLYADANTFGRYIQEWLKPQNYAGAILANLDLFSITTARDSEEDPLALSISSFQIETFDQPYREQWVFPIGGSDISGQPVLADISGTVRNEIIFATENGNLYALASDGTVVMQASTEEDIPVGQPVVYDWYGNNQNVIMLAAGNKIYAWNETGIQLPSFPVILDEKITTPLQVADVTRNGIAEMMVATADRRIHLLNARGEAVNGWPQVTNSVITSPPLLDTFRNENAIFAISENTLHSWQINGTPKNGFPVFLESAIVKSPLVHEDHIYVSGLNGSLYSLGFEPVFADTLAETIQSDSLIIQKLAVSNSELVNTPSVERPLMKDEEGDFYREDLILLQDRNGSIYLYNTSGNLRFTQSMGQQADLRVDPFITDINKNERQNIISLSVFGRLYAWDLLSGEREFDLPTSGMSFPVISDVTGDGNNEIIANTRDGIRAWTIF